LEHWFVTTKDKMKAVKPSETELEILQILWSKGDLTVKQVNDVMNEVKKVGYTTTLKIMQIMYQKGLVSRDEARRSHVYKPLVKPDAIQKSMINKLVDGVFGGSTAEMILSALGSQKASQKELAKIKAFIKSMEDGNE